MQVNHELFDKIKDAAIHVAIDNWSVDHVHHGDLAISVRKGDRHGRFHVVIQHGLKQVAHQNFDGRQIHDEAMRLVEEKVQPVTVSQMAQTFGASPEKAQQIEQRVARRQPITREERLKRQFDKLEAEWTRTKTPPKKASIPLGKGWSVALRRDEVFPDDPGNGTPTMLAGPFGVGSTLVGALGWGIVEDRYGNTVDIPDFMLEALNVAEEYADRYVDLVTEWLATKNA